MLLRNGFWALATLAVVGIPQLAGARERIAVLTVTKPANTVAPAFVDALRARPDVGKIIEPKTSKAWFAFCFDDKTDACILSVMKRHHLDAVWRVWVGTDGNLLAIDSIRLGQSAPASFQSDKIESQTPEELKATAQQAVEQLLGPPPAPVATTVSPTTAPNSPTKSAEKKQRPPAPTEVTQTESGGTSGLRVASYVTAGVGVAALAVGIVEALHTNGLNNDINGDIQKNDTSEVPSALSSAKSSAMIANVGMIAGGALVAAGVVMFFLSPSKAPQTVATATIIDGRPAVAISGHF